MKKFYAPVFFLLRFCFVALLFVRPCPAQNLVSDSSFEYNQAIPTLLSSINMNSAWSSPTRGTTDLFCECSKKLKAVSEAQTPDNPMGSQKPLTGKCYAGIFAFSHGDYREYLLTQLTSPLERGLKYELIFYISLADFSRAAIDQIGACFLGSKVSYANSDVITGLNPVYARLTEDVGTDTVNWHQVSIEYKARGGEQFLLLGSFDVNNLEYTDVKAPKGMHVRINQKTERDAYYYIDAVSLREVHPPPVYAGFTATVAPRIDTIRSAPVAKQDTSTERPGEIHLDKPLVLKNVLFSTNAAVLLPVSFAELDATADQLARDPALRIEVNGYTDNVGSEEQNQKLSEQRAKAVADYFVSRSIDPGRITHKGHGSQDPVATNDTDEGRRQNRRVELRFWR